ncbi:MAG: dihydroneopterin aldolase [Chthoniobacterales bacterium]
MNESKVPEDGEDQIHIEELEVQAHIGVSEEERERSQKLLITLVFTPAQNFRDLRDELARTVNYAVVCEEVKRVAGSHPRKLIETLADELASHLRQVFPITRIRVEVRKFILPETRYVAVSVVR